MSNSIWKTSLTFPEQERVIFGKAPSYNNGVVIRRYTKKSSPRTLLDGIKEWCYLDDLIAQADKAERLEQAVQYLKRLHIATIEKYNPKEKELAEQTIDYAVEIAIEQESNN